MTNTAGSLEHLDAVERMPSGMFLPHNALRTSKRVIVDATAYRNEHIDDLVDAFAELQLRHPYIKPVFLISALDPRSLSRVGYIYETVVQSSEWAKTSAILSYREHIERRVFEMMRVYLADVVVVMQPGTAVPRWIYES